MTDRKEDISVRIVADYSKALADVQRFTGLAEKAFDALPQVVKDLTSSVDKLVDSVTRLGRNDGADRMNRKLQESNQQATTLSRTFDKLLTGGKAIGSAIAAWEAGKMVLAPSVSATMDYGMRLAHATNVTASGASAEEKQRVMKEIDAQLNAARQAGGGTREDVLTGFEALMARNSIGDMKQTLGVLPGIAKTATAGNASFEDLAQATSALVKSLGVAPKDNERALAQLFYSGQIGGFELKNMAHYLPAQAAAARNAGLSGPSAVPKIAALNELAIDAAGTPDQAGVNVADALNAMNSAHLANNLKRFSFDRKNQSLVFSDGKRKGENYIDLGHQLAENAAKGVDAVDTMIQITSMAVKGDPAYAAALKKRDAARARLDAARTRGDSAGQLAAQQDLSAVADSVVQILEGRGIGKLFHNQQELRGLIGVLTNPQAYHDMAAQIQTQGTIANRDNALAFIQSQPGYKAQMFEQDKANALYGGMGGFNDWLGNMAQGISALYQKYPALASAMEGGKLAVTSMGAAAGSAAIALALLTKNASQAAVAQAAGGVPGAPGTGAGGAAGAAGLAGLLKNFGGLLKWGGITNAAVGGLEAYGIYNDQTLTDSQKKIGYTGAAGGALLGSLGAAGAGALAGSIIPGIGTAIGFLIGGLLGGWGGHALGNAAGEAMFGAPKTTPHIPTFAEDVAMRKQMTGLDQNSGTLQRAITGALKPLPVDVRLQVSFDQHGQPYVKQKSIGGGGNLRLDTGPMMTY